jgi:hypothetical protein
VSSDAWDGVLLAISELRGLAEDWDGLGANAVTDETQSSASAAAEAMAHDGWPVPASITATPAGSIGFVWCDEWEGAPYFEVEFIGRDRAEWMSQSSDGEYSHGDLSNLPPFIALIPS